MIDYNLDQHILAANTIRGLTMDAVETAGHGHPGMPMGSADMAVVLWSQFLKHNPKDPHWPNRDRFVQSAGHGSMLIYSLLHLSGYDLSLDDLKNYRKWGSKTPGHPEVGHTVGVETTTGPLGQGISNAVGMALAEQWLAYKFNRPTFPIVDHFTYVIAGDGDIMEGVAQEASSIAGHLGLGKLIVLYDDNGITIDGSTDKSFTEDVLMRYEAYGWHVQSVDGHNPLAIDAAITLAQHEELRPSLIACQTVIGFGSPNKGGTSGIHGSKLGADEVKLTKQTLGIPLEPTFYIADGVYEFMANDATDQQEWEALMNAYREAHPELAKEYDRFLANELPTNWDEILPTFETGKSIATRASSGTALNAIAPHMPFLLGGSADLTGSNKTDLKGEEDINYDDFLGRYLRFGVREHGMGAVMNGLSLHGGVRPYGGTFLVFSDYMRPTIRLAGLMEQPVIYVFTHDSIGLGEDGPTHQPVEHVMSLRLIPNLTVIRPCDAWETAVAWQAALQNTTGPSALILTRQGVPTLDRENQYTSANGLLKGAYILSDADNPQAIIMATGSEVEIALNAQKQLAEDGIPARVVSMPSWELFAQQPADYQAEVLPSSITARVSIEAGSTLGWERYIGSGVAIGLDHYGASADYKLLFKEFGITAETAVQAIKQQL